jgi:hypothetical protein
MKRLKPKALGRQACDLGFLPESQEKRFRDGPKKSKRDRGRNGDHDAALQCESRGFAVSAAMGLGNERVHALNHSLDERAG